MTVGVGVIAFALFVTGAVAFACVSNGNLTLSAGKATSGQIVTVSGRSFNPEPTFSALQARFNTPTGPVLWEGRPASSGEISFSFAVPDVPPGYYVVLIYQRDAAGALAPGMPVRAAIQVTVPGASQDAPGQQSGPPAATAHSTGGGGGVGLLMVALLVAGVAVVAGAVAAAAAAAGTVGPRRSGQRARATN